MTTKPDLLDATGRRIVIEDRTAGVEVLIPTDARPPVVGTRIRVDGTIGRAYDAPRSRPNGSSSSPSVPVRSPSTLQTVSDSAADEWRLVRSAGTVVDVKKLGDRWRAELSVGSERVVVSGLAGARIPATTLADGRVATIVGIVRRPYPGATDRRWSIAPARPSRRRCSARRGRSGRERDGSGVPAPRPAGGTDSRASGSPATPDVDLVDLAGHLGTNVRVGGLVTELNPDGFLLDDGTAMGAIALQGAAAEYLPLLEPGDALNASGRVLSRTVRAIGSSLPTQRTWSGSAIPRSIRRRSGAKTSPSPQCGTRTSPRPPVGSPPACSAPACREPRECSGFVLISVASVAITLLRRRRARHILAARVAVRLAEVGATHGPD